MVARVGFGIRHETAALDLEFNQVTRRTALSFPFPRKWRRWIMPTSM
jgi:hypothetical protein